MLNDRLRWILPVPLLIFGIGAWLYFHTENEVRVQMERAQNHWRQGNYLEALHLFQAVHRNYPHSRYAAQALWEIGTIYYVNFYDIDQALLYFRKLTEEYPQSSLAASAHSKLAEIHEAELGDLPQALQSLEQFLLANASGELHNSALFKMGNLHLKLNEFAKALEKFKLLVARAEGVHLAQQARIRIGTILQIQQEYEQSINYFREVLEETACLDCRMASRLGMIESYEFLGELSKAIETARNIPTSEYPAQMRQDLLQRLHEKARHYQSH